MSSNWFETWFDSPYYHLLYQNRDDKEAEFFLNNLFQKIPLPEHSCVADIPCGKGRHALYLYEKGFDVTGLDLSPESIKQASGFANERLHFYEHDMRKPYTKKKFEAIFNLFTSIGYFEDDADNLNVLKSFNSSLKKNGILVIDFFNTTKVCNELKLSDEIKRDTVTFKISKYIENNRIIKYIDVYDDGKVHHFREMVQLLNRVDFEQLLAEAGFVILNLFGNYALDSFDEQKSERLIIKAQKII
jgi:SAM-dependent methyltransferase